jgi:hypothetical protein
MHVTCGSLNPGVVVAFLPMTHFSMDPDVSAKIQEVVNYCASRLRAALLKMSPDTRTQRKWWHSCFMHELVGVATYS